MLNRFCSGDYRKSQFLFIVDGILVNAAVVLTNGIFLSGYIVFLKGSDFLVGLLNNSSTWASVIAIFSFFIYERMESRKKFLITLNILSRVLVCSIVFLPLLSHDDTFVLSTVAVMVIVGNILWSFYGIGSTVWMMSLLSKESRNEYINIRMLCLRISFTIATIVMGFLLDWFNKSYMGFLIVFATSLVFSIIDIIVLSNAEEPVNKIAKNAQFSLSAFIEPLRDAKYRGFLVFIFFFYISLTTSSAFTPLYLIRYLKFDYGFISTINVISYIMMVICTRIWGRVERKKGLQFVLSISSFFVVGEFLLYSFLTNKTYFLLFFAPILAGIGNSGFNIAIFTYRYELMPDSNRTIYEGWFGAVFGLSTLIAPVIGSNLIRILPVVNNSIYQHSNFQILYLISFISCTAVIFIMFYRPQRLLHMHRKDMDARI